MATARVCRWPRAPTVASPRSSCCPWPRRRRERRTMARLRVLVADDEAPARRVLARLLAAHDDIDVVAECADGWSAVERIAAERPELIFLDVKMPELDGF